MTKHKQSKPDTPAEPPRSRTLSLDEDMRFQQRQWRVERISWGVLVAIIIAALTGVFGGAGPLMQASAASADSSVDLQYARFARLIAPSTLQVNVASADSAGRIRLRVGEDYLKAMTVRSIVPTPVTTALADRQYVFTFERLSAASAAIRLELEPTIVGTHTGWIAVNDGAPLSFTQFVYP